MSTSFVEITRAIAHEARREQSIQILAMLVKRSHEVVLREEIRKRLWPNDTIVEFDHSINAAINRLRGALGDEAATQSRFRVKPT